MKTFILAIIGCGLCVQARCSSLSTIDGATYANINFQRADPDGLYIEYTTAGGGIGMSKVKFSRLSPDQQKRFGFDASKARDYEAKVAQATENYRQECVRLEQEAQARRAGQEAEADRAEKTSNDRIVALARLTEAKADLARAQEVNAGSDWSSWGGGVEGFAIPHAGRAPRARTDYAPIVRPIPFPSRGITRPSR